MTVKSLGKDWLTRRLEKQVKRVRNSNDFKIIAVVGSVGKTGTKMAIAKLLEPSLRVQYQSGNYNDRLTVPLVFFGQTEPAIFDIPAWLRTIKECKNLASKPYPYDVVILELGSDGPGQLGAFKYLKPDITVVTALTAEHMEYFKTIDAVAKEELTPISFSKVSIINIDESPAKYLKGLEYESYGQQKADYHVTNRQPQPSGHQIISLKFPRTSLQLTTDLLGKQGAKAIAVAAAVAVKCGLTNEQIKQNVANIKAFPGRMQLLNGIKNSTIIDDTYNASPVAMKAALDTIYTMPATQRIALLGNMNEMGAMSPKLHKEVGKYCDPTKLDLVITLGPDANQYLAPAAKAQGCNVVSFDSPYKAGEFITEQLQSDAIILVKGSQNRVFAEEAIKSLLADPKDEQRLVRQSDYWMKIKRQQFDD